MKFKKYTFAVVMAFLATIAQGSELGGRYRGVTVNTNPESNLPERTRLALVLTREESGKLSITGSIRMLLDDAKNEQEYVELKLASANLNLSSELLTLKTAQQGLTFKLRTKLLSEGVLKGEIYSDSLGKVAEVVLAKFTNK